LLSEFIRTSNKKIKVILSQEEASSYLEYQNSAGKNISFHYFKPRESILSRALYRIATRITKNQFLLAQVQKYRWKEAIDFIESNSYSCLSMSTYINFPLSGVSHYCTLHDIQEKAFPNFFRASERSIRDVHVKNTLKSVTGLQVSSNFVRDEIKKYYPGQTARINFRVIPEGYSSSELESVIPFNPKIVQKFRIIFPANYWPHKDHITFLKAIASLKNEFQLEVFCTGSTFGKDAELDSILAHMGLDNVQFLGYLTRAELIELYKSSHVVISCSMYESSSLPILEGAVLGCIPIASNIAPHVEMSERLTLELFELGNSSDLESALREVFGRITKADNQVFNVNAIAVKDMSWESLVPQYFEMLEKEVAEGNSK
jgi:glycosyltransferase involved in cell wall biosynthesis